MQVYVFRTADPKAKMYCAELSTSNQVIAFESDSIRDLAGLIRRHIRRISESLGATEVISVSTWPREAMRIVPPYTGDPKLAGTRLSSTEEAQLYAGLCAASEPENLHT